MSPAVRRAVAASAGRELGEGFPGSTGRTDLACHSVSRRDRHAVSPFSLISL